MFQSVSRKVTILPLWGRKRSAPWNILHRQTSGWSLSHSAAARRQLALFAVNFLGRGSTEIGTLYSLRWAVQALGYTKRRHSPTDTEALLSIQHHLWNALAQPAAGWVLGRTAIPAIWQERLTKLGGMALYTLLNLGMLLSISFAMGVLQNLPEQEAGPPLGLQVDFSDILPNDAQGEQHQPPDGPHRANDSAGSVSPGRANTP